MTGLTKHARDKLLAELQSGTMTSGPATISLGEAPPGFKLGGWPTHSAPCEGMITDSETGQAWRVRFNAETMQWEVVEEIQLAKITEADYKAALAEIARLWASPPGTPEGDRLDLLISSVEAYEDEQEVAATPIEGSQMQYVGWNYETAADPPFYHIFSTDAEPMALELGGTLFTITMPQSAQMDALIIRVCEAMEGTIAYATAEHLIRGLDNDPRD